MSISSRWGVYSPPRNHLHKMFGQLFAGVGLGLLVGVLVGLSSSPVVSVVLGALAAGMVTLLGFARSSKDGDSSYAEGSVIRLGGFGVACAAAVLLGVAIRTHSWLSPSIANQVPRSRRPVTVARRREDGLRTKMLARYWSLDRAAEATIHRLPLGEPTR
jgi:hypothetical protein